MNGADPPTLQIAVIIPTFNEGLTIENVVTEFSKALPDATIYVYDNNSTDRTIEAAKAAGRCRPHRKAAGQGKCLFAECSPTSTPISI